MEIGYIKKREITEEMGESYLDYAMSVIVSRALPDVRDGLKPVHRRILYAMHNMGLGAGARYRKSANVVGTTMAQFHPHGDLALYDALARMAQKFSLRYPLVDGQGNWGSIDGDNPAAQRYTECKLTKLAEEMLDDIGKETVNFISNYDDTRREPTVLPAALPQLLLNGAMGIAVGMATNIPPHNLGEIIDGLIYLINKPDSSVEDLFQFIKGPDFPTGGIVYDKRGMVQVYSTGRGPIVSRAKAEIIETKKGRFEIIISELTYQTNKSNLIAKIADLVRNKKIEGIKDIRDESDKEGIRIVIELKPSGFPQKILNQLYRHTELQKVFHLNMLALVGGIQPKVLSLKEVLELYLEHRKEVITRRTRFELKEAEARLHILEGLNKALDHIEEIVALIKKSRNRETAHANLKKEFKFTDRQAEAILEMKLQTLAGLERKKIQLEIKEKKNLIKKLKAILASPKRIFAVIKKEVLALKAKYQDERRTKVYLSPAGKFEVSDLVPEEEAIIVLTKGGYVKRMNPKIYRAQGRGGIGISGIITREKDTVSHFLITSTHNDLLFFTSVGRVFRVKVYEIPDSQRTSRGQALVNFLQISADEEIKSVFAYNREKDKDFVKYLVMATKNGIIKKTKIEDFGEVRRNGLLAIRLKKDDQLRWVRPSSGKDEIILISANGQAIRFKEQDIRAIGRNAAGVTGMRLRENDEVVGMDVIASQKEKSKGKKEGTYLLVITENGFGKKTNIANYRKQRRGGRGIKAAKIIPKTGNVISSSILSLEEDLIVISKNGQTIRTALKNIPVLGRATQGVKVMRLRQGDKVASISCL